MSDSMSSVRKHPAKVRRHLTDHILLDPDRLPFYLLSAALLTFLIECLSRRSVVDAAAFLVKSPLAFLANYGLIFLTLLPALLIPKRVAGLTLLSSVWLILGVSQCIILMCRVTPLSASDITIVFSTLSVVTAYITPWQLSLIVAGLLCVVAGIVLLFIRTPRSKIRWKTFLVAFLLAVPAFAGVIGGGFATGQLSSHFPNLAAAHNDYGFPFCFTMSIVDRGVDKPDRYDENLITDILDSLPPDEPDSPTDTPNVIFVQLESFFDVKHMQGVTFSSDPTPYFTALKQANPSGTLTVPVIGAGTVNTEFEVLTGMRVGDFGAGEYPFRAVLTEKTCESLAYNLRASGLSTHALHNHEGTFYFRHKVYRHLGFETFTPIEYFLDPTFNENHWAHDALLTDEILRVLDSTKENDFVFAVSVQGHGKYPDRYEPVKGDVVITGGLEAYETTENRYNYFIRQIHQMDEFIGDLCREIDRRDEKTVVVFYGDHLPSIARDPGVVLDTGLFQTEYVVYANYDLPRPGESRGLYAYQLAAAVMDMIGNDTGVLTRFHRTWRDGDEEEYLSRLRALTYDVFYGDRTVCGATEYPVMDMQMGTYPVRVTGYLPQDDGFLEIKGENFTEYSVVYMNGGKCATDYVDHETLRIPVTDCPDRRKPCTVTVRQLSAKGEYLSESLPFIALHCNDHVGEKQALCAPGTRKS